MNSGGQKYYVYILSNNSGTIYIGMTNNLERRIWQHKNKKGGNFTSKYSVHRLVYYEEYKYVNDAIAREKILKKWRRNKKIALVETINPIWEDLAKDWTIY